VVGVKGEKEDLKIQRKEYEKQALVQEYLNLLRDWAKTYARMIRSLADAFGEDAVLDIAEKVWWDMAYKVGESWKKKFDENPQAAME